VEPFITAPKQIIASNFLEATIFFAIEGISKAPGTQATVILFSSPLFLLIQSIAPPRSLLVINSLNLEIIIPNFSPEASSFLQ
jgi:hypothetical protein